MPRPTDSGTEHASEMSRQSFGQRSNSFADHDEMVPNRPNGASYQASPDWPKIGAFGAGLAIGIVLGAGATLLFTPYSGEETRELIGKQARHWRGDMADHWDDLRDELRRTARRGRRKFRRGVARGRWMMEDMADRY